MKKIKLENIFKEYDEFGNIVNEIASVSYQITPDEGKCFMDKITGEKFIRQSDGKGAVIVLSEINLEKYEEVAIQSGDYELFSNLDLEINIKDE